MSVFTNFVNHQVAELLKLFLELPSFAAVTCRQGSQHVEKSFDEKKIHNYEHWYNPKDVTVTSPTCARSPSPSSPHRSRRSSDERISKKRNTGDQLRLSLLHVMIMQFLESGDLRYLDEHVKQIKLWWLNQSYLEHLTDPAMRELLEAERAAPTIDLDWASTESALASMVSLLPTSEGEPAGDPTSVVCGSYAEAWLLASLSLPKQVCRKFSKLLELSQMGTQDLVLPTLPCLADLRSHLQEEIGKVNRRLAAKGRRRGHEGDEDGDDVDDGAGIVRHCFAEVEALVGSRGGAISSGSGSSEGDNRRRRRVRVAGAAAAMRSDVAGPDEQQVSSTAAAAAAAVRSDGAGTAIPSFSDLASEGELLIRMDSMSMNDGTAGHTNEAGQVTDEGSVLDDETGFRCIEIWLESGHSGIQLPIDFGDDFTLGPILSFDGEEHLGLEELDTGV